MTIDLNRRKFLERAGTGTIALAGASVLVGASPASADEGGEQEGIGFFFAALDSAGPPPRTNMDPDTLLMQGCGQFDEESGDISGNGFFVHVDARSSQPSPKPIKATGFWEARRLVSFDRGPTFGVNVSGIMVADVNLFPQSPEQDVVIPATLTVICNIPFIPFSTGRPEGFQLVVGNLTFQQLTPTIGISGFDDQSLRNTD